MQRHLLKAVIYSSGTFICGSIVWMMYQQVNVKKASDIRSLQKRIGADFELTEDKRKILERADRYVNKHEGRKLLTRSRSPEFMEEQFKKKIEEKKKKLEETAEDEIEVIEKLRSQIEQLNTAYNLTKPKIISPDDFKK